MESLPNNKKSIDSYIAIARFLLIIALVISLGLFAVNQLLEYRYKSVFLQKPCALCLELNPKVSEQCFIREEKLYPRFNEWYYENGSIYDKESKNATITEPIFKLA